jgi:hypothetical protein
LNWEGGSGRQFIFDFGQNDQDNFSLTPADSSDLPRCSITTDASVYNQVVEGPAAFPVNQWTYVAVVMDGREGILYVNGDAVAVNNSVNLLPSDIDATQCYLGKGLDSSNPGFYGMMSSVALSSSPLPLAELIASARPVLGVTRSVEGLTLSWPQWMTGVGLYASTNLSAPAWTPVAGAPVSSNNVVSVTVPMSNATQFYRLQSP